MRQKYYTLLCSLPSIPPYFEVDRPPISRKKIRERLKMLDEDDAATLQQLVDFLAWDRQPLNRSDREVVAHYDWLKSKITNPVIMQVVDDRIDVRTIVGAFRRRRSQLEPPEGVGQLTPFISRNWHRSDFGLATRYPWISELPDLLESGSPQETERFLFSVTWKIWSRNAAKYQFSFEAVIFYLVRWEILERWTSRNLEIGRQRFDKLLMEALGEYANLDV